MSKQSIQKLVKQSFKRAILITAMSVCGLALFGQVQALESMSDAQLSAESGKGIAFLPENASIVADPNAFIHLKSVGPLDAATTAAGYSPADLYNYGFSLGKSNGSAGDRLVGNIASWGTGNNPFVLKAYTLPGNIEPDGANKDLAVLTLMFPEYQKTIDGTVGADAYNLKLALWQDYMVRNVNTSEGSITNYVPSIGDKSQFTGRMRLQMIWDGFSANGSEVDIFRTPTSFKVSSDPTVDQSSLNGTLGLTMKLRFNSKDDGVAGNTSADGVLRISTQVSSGEVACDTNAAGKTTACSTVARMSGLDGVVPTFNSTEGAYLYNVNINSVMGRVGYQPLTISKTSTGNNLVMELARIPNIPAVYNDFYADYSTTSYTNATTAAALNAAILADPKQCSTAQCGASATHSNISIGNITFKDGSGNTANDVNLGSATISGMMINHLKLTTTGL